MSKLHEKTVDSELVFKGRFLRIQRDRVIAPDGKDRDREFILHPGAALAIPVLDDGSFVMERQYRHAVGTVILEFPAGKLDPGEEPAVAVRRELMEETGYEAREWRHLGRIHPAISYSNEFIDIYLARGLTLRQAQLDPGEHLEVVNIGFDELKALIRRGEITDVKTLSAFLFYEKTLTEGW